MESTDRENRRLNPNAVDEQVLNLRSGSVQSVCSLFVLSFPLILTDRISSGQIICCEHSETMRRIRLSTTERLRLFNLHGRCCHICGGAIDGARERWEIDHVIPWALSHDDRDQNRQPVHFKCHRKKTTCDRKDLAKVARTHAKHLGAWRSYRDKLPGGRDHGWKRKLDGSWVRRD